MSCLGDKAGEVSILPLDSSQCLFPLVVLLSVSLSACLFVPLPVCLSAFLSFSLSICRPDKACRKLLKWRHKLVEIKC